MRLVLFAALFALIPVIVFAQKDTSIYSRQRGASPSVDTTARKKLPADTVRFQFPHQLYDKSVIIPDSVFLWNDYRYTGDFFDAFASGFVRSLGTTGQPEEQTLYGLGFGNISYFNDGMLINDRASNTADMHTVQGESIERIEILPLPRGFLYGPANNAVSVNFVPNEKISPVPYTRFKFYQGAFQEGFVDFRQQQLIGRKLNLTMQVTNRKKDLGFDNSGISNWMASAQLMYPVTKRLTLSAAYQFVKNAPSLFGGINYDTLKTYSGSPGVLLYDELQAPPVNADHYWEQYQNLCRIGGRYSPVAEFRNEFAVYFRENLIMQRFNTATSVSADNYYSRNLNAKVYGAGLRHEVSLPELTFSVNEGIEKSYGVDDRFRGDAENTRAYASAVVSLPVFGSVFVPDVYVKISGDKNFAYSGFGADIASDISSAVKLYAGASSFETADYSAFSTGKRRVNTAEVRFSYTPQKKTSAELHLYAYDSPKNIPAAQVLYSSPRKVDTLIIASHELGAFGAGISFRHDISFIRIEGAMGLLFQKGADAGLPVLSGNAGIYYTGVHFDSSLVVKSGVRSKFYSGYTPYQYDMFYTRTFPSLSGQQAAAGMDLNFFTAGEIKKSAIVYFTWENLLDRQYFLTAYYPMPRRAMRLGIAWQLFN